MRFIVIVFGLLMIAGLAMADVVATLNGYGTSVERRLIR